MGIREEINNCKLCPLYQNMQTSPIGPEWYGHPQIMIIIGRPPKMENDFLQEVITGTDRKILIEYLNKYLGDKWYITNNVKCIPSNTSYTRYSKICSSWLIEEIERVKPRYIIGIGKIDIQNIDCNLPPLNRLLAGKKGLAILEECLIKCQSILTS